MCRIQTPGRGGGGGEILYIEAGDRVLVYGVIYICTLIACCYGVARFIVQNK